MSYEDGALDEETIEQLKAEAENRQAGSSHFPILFARHSSGVVYLIHIKTSNPTVFHGIMPKDLASCIHCAKIRDDSYLMSLIEENRQKVN